MSFCMQTGSTQGAGLTQLIAQGAIDLHLTVDPVLTLFRQRTLKCTNFVMESVPQTFDGNVAWGQEVSCKINKTGDLLAHVYLVARIPGITGVAMGSGHNLCREQGFPCADVCDPAGDGAAPDNCAPCLIGEEDQFPCEEDCNEGIGAAAWYCQSIGHILAHRSSISIGGVQVAQLYGSYLWAWEELCGQPGKELDEMIGKRTSLAQLIEDSKHDRTLYIPLPFWFTLHSGNALPLVSLQFHAVQFNNCFPPLHKCIQVSDCDVRVVKCRDGQPIACCDLQAYLECNYIFCDMCERDAFATGSFQQLITQVQDYTCTANSGNIRAQLCFNNAVTSLIWMVRRKVQFEANNIFNFAGKWNRDPVARATLQLNNVTRFDREGSYFRLVQPFQHAVKIPKGFCYMYSFAWDMTSSQPNGSINMSRIDNVTLNIMLQDALHCEQVELICFARTWNILRFREGLGGVLFS